MIILAITNVHLLIMLSIIIQPIPRTSISLLHREVTDADTRGLGSLTSNVFSNFFFTLFAFMMVSLPLSGRLSLVRFDRRWIVILFDVTVSMDVRRTRSEKRRAC